MALRRSNGYGIVFNRIDRLAIRTNENQKKSKVTVPCTILLICKWLLYHYVRRRDHDAPTTNCLAQPALFNLLSKPQLQLRHTRGAPIRDNLTSLSYAHCCRSLFDNRWTNLTFQSSFSSVKRAASGYVASRSLFCLLTSFFSNRCGHKN
jgi:hypothetical protein